MLLTACAAAHARAQLARDSARTSLRDDVSACARYLDQRPGRRCPVCGNPPAGARATYCSRGCRDRAYRGRRNDPSPP
jgi:hypothetical protein